jgi:methionine-rich copper-binding protein CopC/putative copper export protein
VRLAAIALAALIAALLLSSVIAAPDASAHAVVTASKPADGEQLKTAPSEVRIDFSETISSDLGGLKVLDSAGNRVDKNDSSQPTPTSLRTSLNPGLTDGTFVANYKVVSADGHPISGAIVFAVGNAKIGDVSSLEAKNDPTMEVLSRVGQFLMYLGALLAAGLAFFLAFVHDGAPDRLRLQSIARWSTIVAAVGVATTIVAQAALVTGNGLGAVLQAGTVGPVLRQGLGWSAAVLLVGLAAVHLSVDMKQPVVSHSLAFYGGLAVAGSFVLWGHASEADMAWLAIPADVVHVACGAAWFGGLVGLLYTLRARRPQLAGVADDATRAVHAAGTLAGGARTADLVSDAAGTDGATGEEEHGGGVALLTRDTDDDATVASSPLTDGPAPTSPPERRSGPDATGAGPASGYGSGSGSGSGDGKPEPGTFPATVHMVLRFSNLAAISVILLAIAGTALAYTELGSFSALLTTTYGLTLTVKLALVAAVLFLAGYNRYFLLPWLLPADDEPDAALGGAAGADASDPQASAASGAPSGGDATHAAAGLEPGREGSTTDADADAGTADTASGGAGADEATVAGWRTLVRTLVFEALGIVAILVVTAVLVNVTPGASTEIKGPYQATQAFRDGKVAITIAPNEPGPNNIHLDFTGPDGRPSDVAQKVTLELSLPAKDLGPFTREFVKAGNGHFILENINDLSIAGDWQVTLLVRVSDFDQERVEFQDKVT